MASIKSKMHFMVAIKAAEYEREKLMKQGEHVQAENIITARHFRELDFGRRLRLSYEKQENAATAEIKRE